MKQHLSPARVLELTAVAALTAVLALAVGLALPVASSAQTMQTSPMPSVDPSTGPSVTMPVPNASSEPSAVPSPAPSAMPSPAASSEPSAAPSPAPGTSLGKRALRGVLKSLKGTKAVLKLADGTMQTFNVTSQTAALLKSHLGKNGVFRVVDGVLTLVPSGVPGY